MQRDGAIIIQGSRIGAVVNGQFDNLKAAIVRGLMHRSRATVVLCIHIRAVRRADLAFPQCQSVVKPRCKGVDLVLSKAFTSTLCLINKSTTREFPVADPRCKGVELWSSRECTWAL